MTSGCRILEPNEEGNFVSSSFDGCDENLERNERHNPRKQSETAADTEGIVYMNVTAFFMQIGRDNSISVDMKSINSDIGVKEVAKTGPVLREHWKPEGYVGIGRSRLGFPDRKNDHLVQLLVCKGPDTRETIDITDKYEIAVSVKYDGTRNTGQETPEYQCKRVKSETKTGATRSGTVAFLFRFHEPNVKYKITFALKSIPPKKNRRKKNGASPIVCEILNEVSVTLETGISESKSNKSRMKIQKHRLVEKSTVMALLSDICPAALSKERTELVKRSSWVMKQLQSLRDNAKWEDFDQLSVELLDKFPDVDTQITIKLEESVVACYRNDLERSIQLIDESGKMIPRAKNPNLLTGRSKCYLAGVLRRQRKLGDAEQCVELAEQSLHCCQTNIDTSFVAYEKASVLLDFIARAPQRSHTQVREALSNLEKCVDVCARMETEDGDLYVKKHHFAFIKMAFLLLDCRTEAARERILSAEFISKGGHCLDTLQTKYWSDIAEGVKVQFYLARSDLEYRECNYVEAEKFAQMAKDMATLLGFKTEISPAQERLDHIVHTRALTQGEQDTVIAAPQPLTSAGSEGERGDVSASGSESDWWRFASGSETT